jgi:uncharacterized protein involved in outer membrane biogenesis
MRRRLKLFLSFLIAFVATVFILFQSFKNLAEKNREQVHQELQRFLGKDATFDRFQASWWGGLGFSAEEFRIADNPRFAATPVVRAKELKLGVSLLQLALGRIVVNSLTFEAPEFQIITDERGLLNLSELAVRKHESRMGSTPRATAPEQKPLAVNFLVRKIRIRRGRVDFIDRSVQEPAEIRVKNVEMEVKGLQPSDKTRIRLAAALTEGLGHDIRIDGVLGPLRQRQNWSQEPVELDMRFDSLSVTLLVRALPFLRNRIPRELEVTGPLSFRAKLEGTFSRPRLTDIALKIPLFGSSNYNAILEGSLKKAEGRPWSEAHLQGTLALSSINLAQLRNLPLLKESLPLALKAEGSVNAHVRYEGTWSTLRVGTLIRGEKSEWRYGSWLHKPAGRVAELKAQISRQQNRLVLHDSELSFGSAKMTLSGMVEEATKPRFQLKLRSATGDLPSWWRLVSPLPFHGVAGTLQWDIMLQKNFASAEGWNILGKVNLSDAVFSHKETKRKIDHVNASIAFLGAAALLENGSARFGSTRVTLAAKVPDLSQPNVLYTARSPELELIDLPAFPAGKPNRMKNVTGKGEVRWQDDAPLLRGTFWSSEGNLEDIPYRELQAEITWTPKGIGFDNLSLRAFDGFVRADGYWPASVEPSQRFRLKSQTESLQLESLLTQQFPRFKNKIEGRLNLRAQLNAVTQNGAAVMETLQGSGESTLHQGTLRDFNLIAKIIPGGDSSKGSSRLPANLAALVERPHTSFDTLKAAFKIEEQRIRIDDLLLLTAEYTITGAGWVGFDRTTQWNGLLVLSPRLTQELQREYKLIRYLLDRRGRLSIPFRAEGRLPNVKVRPENRAVADVLRRSFPSKIGEPGASEDKSEKNERKHWLPESLERLLKP